MGSTVTNIAYQRVRTSIRDIKVLNVVTDGKIKTYTLETTSPLRLTARIKVLLWLSSIRPHPVPTSIKIDSISEQGLIHKTFIFIVVTKTLGK